MFETLFVSAVLLLPAVILWLIPKTRRATGSAVTAWKTVPFGCLTMFLIPEILWGLYCWFAEENGIVLSGIQILFPLIGIPAGIVLIVRLRNRIWKRYNAEGPRSAVPFYLVFFGLCLAFFWISVIGSGLYYYWLIRSGKQYHGRWRTYVVTKQYDTELAFQERPIHPFLAEYDYRMRFRRNGKDTFQNLWCNTGGKTYFNIFKLKDGRLLFSDKDQDYLVDLRKQEVHMAVTVGPKVYAGRLPEGYFTSFGRSESQNGKIFLEIDHHRIEALPVTDALKDRTYFGCITTAFHPASKKPYQTVSKRR